MDKNIQFGYRESQSPLLPLHDKSICPVSAFPNLISLNLCHFHDALFVNSKGKCITYYSFQNKLTECVKCLGKLNLEPMSFSSHSFRRGCATMVFQANLPTKYIQLLGDWNLIVIRFI